jgi:hypothetical protein
MKPKRRRRGSPKSKKSSSKEAQMFRELDKLLPGHLYIRNGYYSFLISPRGAPMQLDIFYPELKIAFEYDGKQHHKFSDYFFRNQKQFAYLQECDALKNKLCAQNGITLIRIDYRTTPVRQVILQKVTEAARLDVVKLMEGM